MVVFAVEAKADLAAIGDHISLDSPERAVSFVDELLDCCNRLELNPRAYALVPRFAHLRICKRTFGNYLIFYRAEEVGIEVVRILNAARDYDAILLQDND